MLLYESDSAPMALPDLASREMHGARTALCGRVSLFGPERRRPKCVMLPSALENKYQESILIPTAGLLDRVEPAATSDVITVLNRRQSVAEKEKNVITDTS